MDELPIEEKNGACTFQVKVSPRSSRNRVVGVEGGMLKLKVKAPPVDGAANEEMCAFLSGLLGCSRAWVAVLRGGRSRRKMVKIECLAADHIRRRLSLIP